jgi:hypothetical protein
MANRYTYQFNASFKPKMMQIEGFVSVGTGGLINTQTASGTLYGLLPGNATLGVPTGWVGGFSGTIGLLGAGVKSVVRQATGVYALQLEDDFVRLDSVQAMPVGVTGVDVSVLSHTVGLGNTTASKNIVTIGFTSTTGAGIDLPSGAGFFVHLRLRDSLAGAQ